MQPTAEMEKKKRSKNVFKKCKGLKGKQFKRCVKAGGVRSA